MDIFSIFDPEFRAYGRVVRGYGRERFALAKILEEKTPCPEEGTRYVPEDPALQNLPEAETLAPSLFGGLDVQFGWCNGHNTKLNCLEYHASSEYNLGTTDFILLLAKRDDIVDSWISSERVKAFHVPAGVLVEIYATTLHYAPCQAHKNEGFRVFVCLPRGTNAGPVKTAEKSPEDMLLFAVNKWLIAHIDAPEAKNGAFIGILGENIDLAEDLE